MGVKGFFIEPVATGNLPEMVRKMLDKSKGSTIAIFSGGSL